jgi:hypothetical protein
MSALMRREAPDKGSRNRRYKNDRWESSMEMGRTGNCFHGSATSQARVKSLPFHEHQAAPRRTKYFRQMTLRYRLWSQTGAAGLVCVWIIISSRVILTSQHFFYNTIYCRKYSQQKLDEILTV